MATVQEMLSELLTAQGFARMAQEVRGEYDERRLQHYARIVVKNTPEGMKRDISNRLTLLRLV